MVSNDNSVMMLILDGLTDIRQEIRSLRNENAEFRREMKQDMQSFKAEMKQEMQDFKTEIRQGIKDFKTETNTRFDRIEVQISGMQNDITGLKHDVNNLYTWDYWTLSIILALAVMPYVANGVKAFFGAIAEGISVVIGAFRRDKE